MKKVIGFVRKYFPYAAMIVMLIIGFDIWKDRRDYKKQVTALREEIIKNDSMKITEDGSYQKVVNDLNEQKNLNSQLRKDNGLLSTLIKSKGQQILSITKLNLGLRKRVDTLIGKYRIVPNNEGYVYAEAEFDAYYPTQKDYFIKYNAIVQMQGDDPDPVILSNWDFKQIKIGLTLTQTKNRLWNQYITGPEFVTITDLKVNSLPPDEYIPEPIKKFVFAAGMSYNAVYLDERTLGTPTLDAGLMYNNSWFMDAGIGPKLFRVGIKKIF